MYFYKYNLYLIKIGNYHVFHTVLAAFFHCVNDPLELSHHQLCHQPLSTLSH